MQSIRTIQKLRRTPAIPADILAFAELVWMTNWWSGKDREEVHQELRNALRRFQELQNISYGVCESLGQPILALVGFIISQRCKTGISEGEFIEISLNKLETQWLGFSVSHDPDYPQVHFDWDVEEIDLWLNGFPQFLNHHYEDVNSPLVEFARQDLSKVY